MSIKERKMYKRILNKVTKGGKEDNLKKKLFKRKREKVLMKRERKENVRMLVEERHWFKRFCTQKREKGKEKKTEKRIKRKGRERFWLQQKEKNTIT